jgi:hypothetical protein
MNDHTSSFAHAGQEPVSDISSVLPCLGWQEQGPSQWRRHTALGAAGLSCLHASSTWLRFTISGGYVTAPSAGRYLHHNGMLPAPVKFVRDRQGGVQCRVDVPQPALDTDDGRPSNLSEGWEPLNFQLVRAVTQLVDGCESSAGSAFDPEQVVDQLTQLGRSASRDGQRALVHVGLPGAFGQIRCEQDARIGPRLAADLLTLEVGSTRLHRAAIRLAAEANRRLPLVRFALTTTHPTVLYCEVCLGRVTIPGAWLTVALETMETAMTLTLRELQALRDPTLAQLLLAVSTA